MYPTFVQMCGLPAVEGLGGKSLAATLRDPATATDRNVFVPYLAPDAPTLSATGGGMVQFTIDFPGSESGKPYLLLGSRTGIGPMTIFGLKIPLTRDSVFDFMVSGISAAVMPGAQGILDAYGNGNATLFAGPALAPVVGETIYFAAVTYELGQSLGRMTSVARALEIGP